MAGRTPGPARRPHEETKRLGNPGHRTLPPDSKVTILPGQRTPPEPPRELGKFGREMWDRVWTDAHHWISPTSDVDALVQLCEMTDERLALRAVVLAGGDWRQRSALRALDKQVIDLLQVLGLTPADRSRLGVAEVRIDEVDDFRSRRAQ